MSLTDVLLLPILALFWAWSLPWATILAWAGALLALSALSDLLGELRALRSQLETWRDYDRMRR